MERLAMTPFMIQTAMVEELRRLFQGRAFCGPGKGGRNSGRKPLKIYKQELPIETEPDWESDTDKACAPYIVVKVDGISSPDHDPLLVTELILLICVYDDGVDRQGYEDVLNIITEIVWHFRRERILAQAAEIQGVVEGKMSDEDNHPYYYGAVVMNCTSRNGEVDVEEML